MSHEPKLPISLLQRLKNIHMLHQKPFGKPRKRIPWPDFSLTRVEIFTAVESDIHPDGSQTPRGERQITLFPDAFPEEMVKRGWFDSLEHCLTYSDLTFTYRYPNHTYSHGVLARHPEAATKQIDKLLSDRRAFETWVKSARAEK